MTNYEEMAGQYVRQHARYTNTVGTGRYVVRYPATATRAMLSPTIEGLVSRVATKMRARDRCTDCRRTP